MLLLIALVCGLALAARRGPDNKNWPFDPSMVELVDAGNNTWLFRGPAPLSKRNSFVYDQVKSRFLELASQLPSTFTLVDVSLLGFEGEEPDIEVERSFFAANPSLGSFVWMPLYGVNETVLEALCKKDGFSRQDCSNPTCQPNVYAATVNKAISANGGLDQASDTLITRTAWLRKMMTSAPSTPTVYYYHCECGCDRTGEMTAAYRMRYLGKNFTQVMMDDVSLVGRTLDYENQVASQWFCEWLFYNGLYGFANDCGNCQPFQCQDNSALSPRRPSCSRDRILKQRRH